MSSAAARQVRTVKRLFNEVKYAPHDTVLYYSEPQWKDTLHSAAQEVGEVWAGQNFLGTLSTIGQKYGILEELCQKRSTLVQNNFEIRRDTFAWAWISEGKMVHWLPWQNCLILWFHGVQNQTANFPYL